MFNAFRHPSLMMSLYLPLSRKYRRSFDLFGIHGRSGRPEGYFTRSQARLQTMQVRENRVRDAPNDPKRLRQNPAT